MSGATKTILILAACCAAAAAVPARAQDEAPTAGPAPVVLDSTLTATGEEISYDVLKPTVSPTAAVLMTPVFPGWGQLAADNGWRSVAVFAYDMYLISRALMSERKAVRSKQRLAPLDQALYDEYYHRGPGYGTVYVKEHYESMRDNFWWAGGVLLIAALDAYVGAHLQDFDRDAAPMPGGWDPADVPQPVELPASGPTGAVLMSWSTGF
jgi:hypothetical protein